MTDTTTPAMPTPLDVATLIAEAEEALAGRASLITSLEQVIEALSEAQDRENDVRTTLARTRELLASERATNAALDALLGVYGEDVDFLLAELDKANAALAAQEVVVIRAQAMLDEEPLIVSLVRLAFAPVAMARFVVGAARSKL